MKSFLSKHILIAVSIIFSAEAHSDALDIFEKLDLMAHTDHIERQLTGIAQFINISNINELIATAALFFAPALLIVLFIRRRLNRQSMR